MQSVCVEMLSYMCSYTNVILFRCFQWRSVVFKEWLYGSKNQWPEEPPKAKQKKKERLIYKAPIVKYECGVKSNYGIVLSELRICHYYGHMVDYDEVDYFCGKHKIIFCFFC